MKFQDLFPIFIIFCCVQSSNACIQIQNVATITMESQCNGTNNQRYMHRRCRMTLVKYYTWIELIHFVSNIIEGFNNQSCIAICKWFSFIMLCVRFSQIATHKDLLQSLSNDLQTTTFSITIQCRNIVQINTQNLFYLNCKKLFLEMAFINLNCIPKFFTKSYKRQVY